MILVVGLYNLAKGAWHITLKFPMKSQVLRNVHEFLDVYIRDYFSYRINFHSEVKNKGVYTMHAALLCCQLMSHCRHGNK
jgi:hypothetical protein